MSNFIDNIVSYISPRQGYLRESYRKATEAVRGYDAASMGKRTKGWKSNSGSANSEVSSSLVTLRNRARELFRNNGYSARAINVIANNTVGSGIMPSPVGTTKAIDKKIKTLWDDWAKSKSIDYHNRMNFYAIQHLCMKTIAQSGEVILRKRIVKGNTIPVKYQILEGDYIDHSKDGVIFNKNFIKQGIEINDSDQIVAYWLFSEHPGENTSRNNFESKRVPAEEIIHVFLQERPGQLRGVPFGTAGMLKSKDLEAYEDAQLTRQKIAACFTGFRQNSDIAGFGTSTDSVSESIQPGRIEKLLPGETMTFSNPPAADNYESYTKAVQRNVASGYNVTYEAMTNDLSNVNFSSGRMGWLEFHRQIGVWQNYMLIPQLCEAIWDDFMKFAVIGGYISKPVKASWTPPRREMIDPVKETNAMNLAVRNGFTSLKDVIRQNGLDPEDVMEEISKSNELLDSMGLVLDSDPRKDANRIKNELKIS